MFEQSLIANLSRHWNRLIQDSHLDATVTNPIFTDLCSAYSGPTRHYHNLYHINQMLDWLEQAGVNAIEAGWATWFHDVVYVAGRSDNEALSAERAKDCLTKLGLTSAVVVRTTAIILATQTHSAASTDPVLAAVLDADMAILGSPAPIYKAYSQAVRAEYSALPDFVYYRGRRQFLQSVINSDRIFATPWFFDQFELQARKNIDDELSCRR